VNDAVEALQAKVGADSSAVTSSLDYKVAQLEAISHGKILQVVSTTSQTHFSTTSGAFTTVTGLAVTITPTSATSKVLVLLTAGIYTSTNNQAYVTIYRGATNLGNGIEGFGAMRDASATSHNMGFAAASFLDSPATTSATTYQVYTATNTGQVIFMHNGKACTITAIEVAA